MQNQQDFEILILLFIHAYALCILGEYIEKYSGFSPASVLKIYLWIYQGLLLIMLVVLKANS